MVGLGPERGEDHEAEKHPADQEPEREEQDEENREEMFGHGAPKIDFEPDLSGYVDEYRFVPLTPSLEDALAQIVEKIDAERGDASRSEIRFSIKLGDDECRELAALGYLSEQTAYINGDTVSSLTPKGSRYGSEKAAYVERRDRWVASRRLDRDRQQWHQLGMTLLGFVGGVMTAMLSGLLQFVLDHVPA